MPALGSLPSPRLRGTEDRFNHGHVANGVLDGNRNFAVSAHGARKNISLNSVLITSRKTFGNDPASEDIAAVVDKDAARAVIRGVEWYFDFDTALRPEELHSLVRNELRAACEDALA